MGECVKSPLVRASSTPLVVGMSVSTIVLRLFDRALIQQLTFVDVVWGTLTIACCVLVLPFLLSSLQKVHHRQCQVDCKERAPSPSSVLRADRAPSPSSVLRAQRLRSLQKFLPGRAPSPSSVRRTAGSGKSSNETRCGDGRSDVSDAPSTSAWTVQETIIDSQRSAGMMPSIPAIDTTANAADFLKTEKLFADMQPAGEAESLNPRDRGGGPVVLPRNDSSIPSPTPWYLLPPSDQCSSQQVSVLCQPTYAASSAWQPMPARAPVSSMFCGPVQPVLQSASMMPFSPAIDTTANAADPLKTEKLFAEKQPAGEAESLNPRERGGGPGVLPRNDSSTPSPTPWYVLSPSDQFSTHQVSTLFQPPYAASSTWQPMPAWVPTSSLVCSPMQPVLQGEDPWTQEIPDMTVQECAAPRLPGGVPSIGSMNHPHGCADFCKYALKARGCKDGAACDHCHICIKPNRQPARRGPRS